MSSKSINPAELAKRYAFALLQEAEGGGGVAVIADELNAFKKLDDESPEFHLLLTSSIISKTQRREALDAVIEKADASDLMRRFLGVLAENDRLLLLPKICAAFEKLRDENDGYIDAAVTCAAQPDDDVLEKLVTSLSSVYHKKIRLKVTVDGDLIGGMTVRVGSVLVDGSVKTKLQKLTRVMKGVEI